MSLDKLKFAECFQGNIVRSRKSPEPMDFLNLRGKFRVEQWRKGKLLEVFDFNNTIMNAGKNSILDVYFNSASPIASSSWFVIPISSASYSAIAATDTMSSHAGWTEFTAYSESTRQAWGQGSAASQAITNASPAVITANATGTVKGFGICSNSTKGGTSGLLWCAGLFTQGDANLVSSDELRITYNLAT